MTTAKYTIEELFTYRLHVIKKQTDRTMNEAFSSALGLSLTEARILLSVGGVRADFGVGSRARVESRPQPGEPRHGRAGA
jgi:hypothetical protein